MSENILSVDIGGSKIVVGIVNSEGSILCSQKIALPPRYDTDFLIREILNAAKDYAAYNPIAVGATVPGLADVKNGIWKYAPFSGISDFPIAEILSVSLGLKVFIENDVNACAVGEKVYGRCKCDASFIWLTVSNGIGGAVYLNNSLYSGDSGNAGEIGHFIVDEKSDAICGCGRAGCLEALASGKGIERTFSKLSRKKLTAKEIALLAKEGDKAALEAYETAGSYLGKALSYCINLLNIQKIIIGGGVSESFDLLEAPINAAIEKYVFKQANSQPKILKTGLGYYAALIGAAAVSQINLRRE